MNKHTLIQYQPDLFETWNRFIETSRNATFLFHRDYMDYHSDRFQDHSLLIYREKQLRAVLPAHISGDILQSHGGLTYGGFLLDAEVRLEEFLELLQCVLYQLHSKGIKKLLIKEIPHIYHQVASEEMQYALFLLEAKLTRRDTLSVIDLKNPLPVASSRMQGVKRAMKLGVEVKESENFAPFWNEILVPNIQQRYQTNPVHSLAEIQSLKSAFPHRIRLFEARLNGNLEAGCVIFETDTVAHLQYVSGKADRTQTGAIDFLHYQLITDTFAYKVYFDFGSSNEDAGQVFNSGLTFWKESYGARTVVQSFYEIETARYTLLNDRKR